MRSGVLVHETSDINIPKRKTFLIYKFRFIWLSKVIIIIQIL